MKGRPQLRRSLLDRLVDHAPKASAGPTPSASASLASVSDAVLRDLENLLNTRRPPRNKITGRNGRVPASILDYGTGDFSSMNPRSHQVRQEIRREIETLLLRFEPRFKKVTVRIAEDEQSERSLRFVIEALMQVEPVAVPIAFSTSFDINRGAYSVTR